MTENLYNKAKNKKNVAELPQSLQKKHVKDGLNWNLFWQKKTILFFSMINKYGRYILYVKVTLFSETVSMGYRQCTK